MMFGILFFKTVGRSVGESLNAFGAALENGSQLEHSASTQFLTNIAYKNILLKWRLSTVQIPTGLLLKKFGTEVEGIETISDTC
jgi:hypothetical protein